MAQLPPPSLPPSHPTYRHLGTAAVDRSVRAQMVIALVAGLVMVAVPLYLWRRPKADVAPDGAEARKPAASGAPSNQTPTALDNPATTSSATSLAKVPGLLLTEPKIVKCSKIGAKISPEQCDRQPYFEEALLRAIQENTSCAPEKPGSGSVNFVLDVDHKAKKLRVWAGKTGSMKRAQRKKIIACVNKALPTPDWAQIAHQNQKYQIAVLATYP